MVARLGSLTVITLSIALTVALLAMGCSSKDESEAKGKAAAGGGGPGARGPTPVRLAQAERGSLEAVASMTGELLAEQVVDVAPLESGQLLTLEVEAGDRVVAGQPIGQLDVDLQSRNQTEAGKALQSAKARVAQVKAQIGAQEREVERRRKLAKRNAFPAAELQKLEDELGVLQQSVDVARAQVSEAQAQVSSTRTALQRRAVEAPFAGVVVARHVSAGATVGPQTPIVTIVDESTLLFVASISEARVGALTLGAPATVRFDAYPDEVFAATVHQIGDVVDRASRTMEVKLALTILTKPTGPDEAAATEPRSVRLRHGMFGRAEIVLKQVDNALIVPFEALDRGREGTRVWSVVDGAAKPYPVKVLVETERQVAIEGAEAPLSPDIAVVVSGTRGLKPDAPVTVSNQDFGSSALTPDASAEKGGER